MTKKNRHQYHVRLNDKDATRASHVIAINELENFGQMVRYLLRKETKDLPLFEELKDAPPAPLNDTESSAG